MPFSSFPIPTNPWLTWAWAASRTGAITSRTGPQRAGDCVNVLDFGAVADGATDNSRAFTNAIAQNGLIYFPPGNYLLTNTVTLPYSGTPLGGENYFCVGYGAFVHGNIAGWLFHRPATGGFSDNQDRKGFFGFAMQNDNAAGGCIHWGSGTDNIVEDCNFVFEGIGVAGWNGNGPQAAVRCKFLTSGNFGTTPNSTGVAFSSIGGLVESCDFTSLDRCIQSSGSNTSIIANRFEVDNWGICAGMPPTLQVILSTAAGTGTSTILNMSNTLMFTNGDGVTVTSFSGASYHVNGAWTVTVLNATQLSINTSSFTADTLNADAYIWINLPGGGQAGGGVSGGSGLFIGSNTWEGCTIGIYGFGIGDGVINSCAMLMDQHTSLSFPGGAPNGWSRCGIYMRDFQQALVVQGCNFIGLCTLGGIYFAGSTTNGPYNSVFQANNFGSFPPTTQSLSTGIVNGNSSINPSSLLLYEMPRWLVFPVIDPGLTGPLKVLSISTVPTAFVGGGIALSSTTGNTLNLASAFTGVAADGAALTFIDASSNIINAGVVSGAQTSSSHLLLTSMPGSLSSPTHPPLTLLVIGSVPVTIPSGTTVSGTSGTTISLSHTLTGVVGDGATFVFTDSAGLPVGLTSLF
jgi:hypothetical protein